jgi:hypothetical protein
MAERTLKVRPEGLQIFRRWAFAITRAELRGETVPNIDEIEAVLEWLDERKLIEPPVDRAQARVLIELVRAGGVHTFEDADEQLPTDA